MFKEVCTVKNKFRRLMCLILTLTMMLSLGTSAHALSIVDDTDSDSDSDIPTIVVDGEYTIITPDYVLVDSSTGEIIFLVSYENLCQCIPVIAELPRDILGDAPYDLAYWASIYAKDVYFEDGCLYIINYGSTDGGNLWVPDDDPSDNDSNDNNSDDGDLWIPDDDDDTIPVLPLPEPENNSNNDSNNNSTGNGTNNPTNRPTDADTLAVVYVNGVRVTGVNVYVRNAFSKDNSGTALIFLPSNDIPALFPKETENTFFSEGYEESRLEDWAERYDYKLVTYGNNVFLNNNGETPGLLRLNGTQVDCQYCSATVKSPGVTFVPLKIVSEYFGCVTEWSPEYPKRVVVRRDGSTMILWIGNTTYWVDGTYKQIEVAPFVRNDTTLVPIRIIIQELGYNVKWSVEDGICIVEITN